jgi:hypothetical protein
MSIEIVPVVRTRVVVFRAVVPFSVISRCNILDESVASIIIYHENEGSRSLRNAGACGFTSLKTITCIWKHGIPTPLHEDTPAHIDEENSKKTNTGKSMLHRKENN